MKNFAKLIIAGAIAGTIVGAAGSVAAGSTGKRALYPPVPKVNKNSTIPQKKPLRDRLAPGPKSGAASGKAGAGEEGPRFGVERASPERQIPEAPIAATNAPAGAKGPGGSE